MWRTTLFVISGLFLAIAASMWFTPHTWYETVPGVAMMGPFNLHFIRDIALAFLMSAGALIYGAWKLNSGVAITGAVWPCLHGLFHISIWIGRGVPLDDVAMVNLFGIQLPAWLALAAAIKLQTEKGRP